MSFLDPAFVQRLARLALVARRRFAGASAGARRSTRRGSSAEHADHRPYFPGDDVRRIDWNAFARLDELVLRLFVAEDDLSLYLLIDTSGSVAFGGALDAAKRLSAALGYLALSGSDRVSVWPFASGIAGPPFAPTRGRRRIGALLRALEQLSSGGETNLARTIEQFLARRPRPGLVAIVSDFLDPAGFARPIDRLLAEKHEPVLFHLDDAAALDADLGADLVLVDAERGTEVEVTIDRRALAAYRARVDRFSAELAAYAKKRGLFYGRVPTDAPFEDVLLSYLRAA